MDDGRTQVLWTGGWDSTFRVLQLLLVEKRPVEPIYMFDSGRRSSQRELQTMEHLRDQLRQRMDDPSLLAPLRIFLSSDYPPSDDLIARYRSLHERAPFGPQYPRLAGIAEAHGWRNVELCMERTPGTPSLWNQLLFDRPGVLNSSWEAELFQYWSFPVIDITKERMRDIAEQHGFLDLLLQRWFCFDPLMGKPCGRCYPCRHTVPEGVDYANRNLARARFLARRVTRAARGLPAERNRLLPQPA
jgi:hypothetical protein